MEKRFTRNEGHPFSRVNLGERFNVREKSCHVCAIQSRACACFDYLILNELTQLGKPKLVFTMYIGETFVRLRG